MTTPIDADRVPWLPAGLPPVTEPSEVTGWRYVVVEEIVDDVAVLRRWPWPLTDSLGHLYWSEERQEDSVAVALELLRAQIYVANQLQRSPRIGDTFAVVSTEVSKWPQRTTEVVELFTGQVYDVSAEARQAAKLAYQGSLTAVLGTPEESSVAAELSARTEEPVRARTLTIEEPPSPNSGG